MRIIYICLLLIFAGTEISVAQTQKGTQFLGLGLSGGSETEKYTEATNDNKYRSFNLSLMPNYSYFIADGWELRGGLGFGLSGSRREYGQETSKSTYKALISMVSFRKHLMLSEKLGFATGPYGNYVSSKTDYDEGNDGKAKQYSVGLGVDIEYFPMKQFGIAANLLDISQNRNEFKLGGKSISKQSYFHAGLTNQISLRFFYVFGKGLR